nr:MAG TPA: hypothetical protein [Bacteriophage sp.]
MSIVNLKCSNHNLTLGSTPILASGSQNVDTISVEFDESWDSYGVKEAIFWRATEPNVAYRQIFENYASTAVIPANVLAEKGNIIFCLRGINGDDIITTTVVTLDVVEGVAVEGRDPSIEPSVYDEILKELQNIRLTCGEQIIEQNKKYAIEVWVGTQAEYDALETKPENTLCIITDEIGSKELLEQATAAVEEANGTSDMFKYILDGINTTLLEPNYGLNIDVSELTNYRIVYYKQDDFSQLGYKTVMGGIETDPEGLYVADGLGEQNSVLVQVIKEKTGTKIYVTPKEEGYWYVIIRPYTEAEDVFKYKRLPIEA